jgi:hypothetical protein
MHPVLHTEGQPGLHTVQDDPSCWKPSAFGPTAHVAACATGVSSALTGETALPRRKESGDVLETSSIDMTADPTTSATASIIRFIFLIAATSGFSLPLYA